MDIYLSVLRTKYLGGKFQNVYLVSQESNVGLTPRTVAGDIIEKTYAYLLDNLLCRPTSTVTRQKY